MYKFYSALFILVLLFASGCKEEINSPVLDPANESELTLDKITIPPGAILKSALLKLWVKVPAPGNSAQVFRANALWSENTVTWNTFNNQFNPAVLATFSLNESGSKVIDITATVQGWMDGSIPNHGIFIKGVENTFMAEINSSEHPWHFNRPSLVLNYELNGMERADTIRDGHMGIVEDAYISAFYPNSNYYGAPLRVGENDSILTASLIKFDLIEESAGCTYSHGYWKNHLDHTAWMTLKDKIFYLSEQKYPHVLKAPPKGNPYFILAKQYIAAKLNVINGASTPLMVTIAMGKAELLFSKYTPGNLSKHKNSREKMIFLCLASILEKYNSGRIGPGHCD